MMRIMRRQNQEKHANESQEERQQRYEQRNEQRYANESQEGGDTTDTRAERTAREHARVLRSIPPQQRH